MDVHVKYSYLQFALEPMVATHIGKVMTLILWCQVMNIIVTHYSTRSPFVSLLSRRAQYGR